MPNGRRRSKRQEGGAEGEDGAEAGGTTTTTTTTVAPKRARRRVRAARGTPLWELLPDELVQRIVGYVRQRYTWTVLPSPHRKDARSLFWLKSMRLVNRALANGLHTVALMSVPAHHPDHVDAFTEGLVRLASDLFNTAQQEELGRAHVSYTHHQSTTSLKLTHAHLLDVVVKRAMFQSRSPGIFRGDYRRAVCMHLRMRLPEGKLALPASARDKERMVAFLTAVVVGRGRRVRDGRFTEDVLRSAIGFEAFL